jgi:DNA-binding Lrp family transcriptional regulator
VRRTRSRPSSATSARPLDFTILCERYRDAPGGLGFDPRKSPERIARALRVSPATVRRRLGEWRKSGFFLGYEVLPHPELLGGQLMGRLLEFGDAISQQKAVQFLELIDGVVQIVPSRNYLLVAYFVDSERQTQRRLLQFREIDGVRSIGPEMPFPFAPCRRRMSRADWRLVQALRNQPEASLAVLAHAVGQSPRTTSRRWDALLTAGAIVYDPILDFSRFPLNLAVLVVFLDSSQSAESVTSGIRSLLPQSERTQGPALLGPDRQDQTVQFLLCAATAAELDRDSGRVAHLPGVKEVLLWYEQTGIPVKDWLDGRIEAQLTRDRLGN